jgi:hypothetical protein
MYVAVQVPVRFVVLEYGRLTTTVLLCGSLPKECFDVWTRLLRIADMRLVLVLAENMK